VSETVLGQIMEIGTYVINDNVHVHIYVVRQTSLL